MFTPVFDYAKYFDVSDSEAVNTCCRSAVAIAVQEGALSVMANITSERANTEPHHFQGLEFIIFL